LEGDSHGLYEDTILALTWRSKEKEMIG